MQRPISMVAGSTGLVGKALVNNLVSKGQAVRALVRTQENTTNPLLEYLRIDFDNFQLPEEKWIDVKDLYICLGTTIKKAGSKEAFQKVDINYCLEVAKEAQKFGVSNVSLITSLGSDEKSSNFYLKSKGIIENYISELDFDSIAIHRPGLLIGARPELRLAELLGQKIYPFLINPFLMGYLRKYRCVDGDILAKAMINLSGTKEGTNFYYFDDFKKNQ
jgi:uncharacterized protein YbjT (DUF2867 family)